MRSITPPPCLFTSRDRYVVSAPYSLPLYSTLFIRHLNSVTCVYTLYPLSELDYSCLHSLSVISTLLHLSRLAIRSLNSIIGVYARCPVSSFNYRCLHSMSLSKIKGFETLSAVTAILLRVSIQEFNSQFPDLPMA